MLMDGGDGGSGFTCNICLESADKDPIVTPCGHLYCKSCIYTWLRNPRHDSNRCRCPVCNAVIRENKLIPLYGIGKSQYMDQNSRSVPEDSVDSPERKADQDSATTTPNTPTPSAPNTPTPSAPDTPTPSAPDTPTPSAPDTPTPSTPDWRTDPIPTPSAPEWPSNPRLVTSSDLLRTTVRRPNPSAPEWPSNPSLAPSWLSDPRPATPSAPNCPTDQTLATPSTANVVLKHIGRLLIRVGQYMLVRIIEVATDKLIEAVETKINELKEAAEQRNNANAEGSGNDTESSEEVEVMDANGEGSNLEPWVLLNRT